VSELTPEEIIKRLEQEAHYRPVYWGDSVPVFTQLSDLIKSQEAQIKGLVEALEVAVQQIRHHHINDPCGGCSAAREHIEPVLTRLPSTYLEKHKLEREVIEAAVAWSGGFKEHAPGHFHRDPWLAANLNKAVKAYQTEKEGKP
jgi:hypothetical protein